MPYYNITNEDSLKLLNLRLEVMEQTVSFFPDVIRTIEKFDGKVLNKRLNTALEQIDRNLSYERKYDSIYIVRYIGSESVNTENGCSLYLNEHHDYLCIVSPSGNNYCLTNDNRIIATGFADALNKEHADYVKRIKEIKDNIVNIDSYRARLKQIKEDLEILKSEIPYPIRNYCNLNWRIVRG